MESLKWARDTKMDALDGGNDFLGSQLRRVDMRSASYRHVVDINF